jgi:hypothetical protein
MSTATALDPLCQQRRARFVEEHRVKKMGYSYRNLRLLLMQGGHPDAEVRQVLRDCFLARGAGLGVYTKDRWLSLCAGRGRPFDHHELWGRDRTPLFMIGHPYHAACDEAQATLNRLRSVGMEVRIDATSWYGHGTVQVRAFHWATASRYRGEAV